MVTMGTNWQRTPLVTMEPSDVKSVTTTTATHTLQNVSCLDLGTFDGNEKHCFLFGDHKKHCFLFITFLSIGCNYYPTHTIAINKQKIDLNLNCMVVTCNYETCFGKATINPQIFYFRCLLVRCL